MKTTHFTYPSADQETQIHAVEWAPDEGRGIVAVLQIAHGMQEYIERYEEYASWMCERGVVVVGNDHLGHGASVVSEDRYGYFADKNGNKAVLSDMRTLHRMMQEKYPRLPYFLLGHSMGSFLARQYICMYGQSLDGAIISGTGYHTVAETQLGMRLCSAMARQKGWHYRSPFITNMVMGRYNDRIRPARTKQDWLSRDQQVVDAYRADKRTQYMFTLNGYHNMFASLQYLTSREHLQRIPKTLPVFFISGGMDPVGNYGAGVKSAAMQLRRIGMNDITFRLYPNDRHEVLNELDRQDVYKDVWRWMQEHM